MSKKEAMIRKALFIDKELWDKMEVRKENLGIPVSRQIRDAVKAYLAEKEVAND